MSAVRTKTNCAPRDRSRLVVWLVFAVGLSGIPLAGHAQKLAGYRVSGQVVSAADHRPLPHAKVALETSGTQGGAGVAKVNATEDGRFVFENVPAGKFRLMGFAPGFLSSAYQQHEGYSTAIVTGAGVSTTGLQLELTPGASISGQLTDEAGEPIIGGGIMLYRQRSSGSEQIVEDTASPTDDRGGYEFENLTPGRYFLCAMATPWYAVHPSAERPASDSTQSSVDPALDVAYPMVFYPNALDSGGAAPIVLEGGEEFTANLQMQPMRALTITLHGPPPDPKAPPSGDPQIFRTVFGSEMALQQTTEGNQATGDVRITGVPPGHYTLINTRRSGHATTIDLNTEPISVDLGAPPPFSTVQAAIRTLGEKPLPHNLNAELTMATAPAVTGSADARGALVWREVPDGDYKIVVGSNGKSLPVMNLAVQGHPVQGNTLHVGADGGTISVDITIATNTVNVEGFARRNGKAGEGAMIALIPAGKEFSEELLRRDQSDLDGSFLLSEVYPGNYLLVAIDDGWPLRLKDPAAMQRYLLHAVPVSISATSSGSLRLSDPVAVQPR